MDCAHKMKWFLYNVLFSIAYMAMMPHFLLRMKRRGGYRARMGDRFGRYPEETVKAISAMESPVWIHAVSVGEVQVAGQLMRAMREVSPNVRFVFSTTSSTGWKVALKEVGEGDVLMYNPLDFMPCVRRALDLVKPRAVILTETEIWPNFIRMVTKRGIPIFLANARISDRSSRRYPKLKWFFGEIFARFTKIWTQSELDRRRLIEAGARDESIAVTGSFKFDVARRNPAKESELGEWIGAKGLVIVGGSTWPGEDAFMLRAYREVLKVSPEATLVLAPRHFEKADQVEANIAAAGFGCIRRSRGESVADAKGPSVFLCDTTGEMMGLWGLADIAFVGKSLFEHGSQNMIEPCLCGAATLVGPNTENFRPVMSDLLDGGALLQLPDEAALTKEIVALALDASRRKALGAKATAAVERRKGVVGRVASELCERLSLSGH